MFSCEKLKPESVSIPEYPDLEQLYHQQTQSLASHKLKKEVWLDGKNEVKMLDMDTTEWKKELSFLKEINPNTPEYVSAFRKVENESEIQLKLSSGEKGELKMLTYSLNDDGFTIIKATIHEEKEVYVHHRDFDLSFEKGLLKSYEITGYQKIVLKDTIEFKIVGSIN